MNMKKIVLTFTAVVMFHVVVGFVLLLQPGCKSSVQKAAAPEPVDAAKAAPPIPPTTVTPVPTPTGAMAGGPFTAPTRPTTNMPATPVAVAKFNAGPEPLGSVNAINATPAPASSASPVVTYVVAKGDSLSAIAKKNGVTVNELIAANAASKLSRTTSLRAGQELTIPHAAAPAAAAPDATASAEHTYTVVSGDSLTTIARKQGTTLAALRSANNLTTDTLRVGQVLKLPVAGTATSATAPTIAPATVAATSESDVYVVKSGDTLESIAKKHGTKLSELMTLNNITNPLRLQIGQKIKLPSGTKTTTPSSAPAAPATATTPVTPVTSVTPVTTVPSDSPPVAPVQN